MNTKLLMGASAVFMAIVGVLATFMPAEILAHAGAVSQGLPAILIQIAGALYCGFAILNWMARANVIGGIYSRPIVLGNFLHFTAASAALVKGVFAGHYAVELVVGASIYSVFAVWFGSVLFTHPKGKA